MEVKFNIPVCKPDTRFGELILAEARKIYGDDFDFDKCTIKKCIMNCHINDTIHLDHNSKTIEVPEAESVVYGYQVTFDIICNEVI